MPDRDQPDQAEERIEAYLDDLLLALRGHPRQARRVLSEVESHIRDSVEAGLAAGLDEIRAVEEALDRFGPPRSAARGLSALAAYRILFRQLAEAALLVAGMLCLTAGAAAVPAAILGLAGHPNLVTGDQRGVSVDHLQDVIRAHLASGWIGFLLLAAWWVVYVYRRGRPAVLPTGFALTVSGTVLAVLAAFFLAIGIDNSASGLDSTAGVIGSGDLAVTGATMLAAAAFCGVVLARQVARPGRGLAGAAAGKTGRVPEHPPCQPSGGQQV
jgi:hypothetical protein